MDVKDVIREMTVLLRTEAIRSSIMIHAELDTDVPNILADRVKLQQVFMNLMLNAIEAMKDTGGELRIRPQLNPESQCTSSAANPATPCLLASNFSPAINGFGNQRRNQFTGPSYFNTDLSITKNFKVPRCEGAQFGIGAQFFNILNHPHFDQPDADIASPTLAALLTR